jgi:hypothetical protein
MHLVEEPRTGHLQAELSALRQEKACLISEMKSDSTESFRNVETMIRYSLVITEIRAVVDELRLLGAAG